MTNEAGKTEMKDRARRTPYELVFMEGDFESEHFPRIRVEALETNELSELGRDAFDFVRAAGDLVRQVSPPDAPPEAVEQYRAMLFHAFHFWDEDHRLLAVDGATVRYLVESAPELGDWSFAGPGRCCYIQLPANLFWSSIASDVPPEPVDGFFVTITDAPGDSDVRMVDILMVLGIHRGRAGFSVIPLSTEVGEGVPPAWESDSREGGDFSNELPGGELAGLYSLLTAGEVFKLIARICWYRDTFPEARLDIDADGAPASDDEAPRTQFSYTRLTLGDAEGG